MTQPFNNVIIFYMILLDYNLKELQEIVSQYNQPIYRAKQILEALYKYNGNYNSVPKHLIGDLSKNYILQPLTIHSRFESKIDGTVKYLLKLHDNNLIECVLMKYKYGNTLCVSTQVGCRMNCKFCASSLEGLIRNLSSGEILAQVLAVNSDIGGQLGDKRKITNIVLMGSGEPLDNYNNVVKFLQLVGNDSCMNISGRNISLSTCGLVPQIRQLIKDNIKVTLTLSLHACTDAQRQQIMPIAKAYSMNETIQAFLEYVNHFRRGVVEYSLIEGVNDNIEDIKYLVDYFRNQPVHINIIRLNRVKERGLNGTSNNKAHEFCKALQSAGLSASLRRILGSDIEGACGQLRRKVLKNENASN